MMITCLEWIDWVHTHLNPQLEAERNRLQQAIGACQAQLATYSSPLALQEQKESCVADIAQLERECEERQQDKSRLEQQLEQVFQNAYLACQRQLHQARCLSHQDRIESALQALQNTFGLIEPEGLTPAQLHNIFTDKVPAFQTFRNQFSAYIQQMGRGLNELYAKDASSIQELASVQLELDKVIQQVEAQKLNLLNRHQMDPLALNGFVAMADAQAAKYQEFLRQKSDNLQQEKAWRVPVHVGPED